MAITRREALAAMALAGPALALGARGATAAEPAAPPAAVAVGQHKPVPLPFDPKSLHGLSERMIVSHHDNNYAGAIKNLNAVEAQLASVTKDTPGFLVSGLKERELAFTNSMILHELYFANLGGDGKPGSAIQSALATAFGSYGRFEELFRSTGMSLAGGSGWTILELSLQTGEPRIYWSGNHTQTAALAAPLLVLDMYEHAYQMDFGAAAAQYVDAFFANVRWDEVGRRHERALAAQRALRG